MFRRGGVSRSRPLREAAIASGKVTAEEFDRIVDPSKMTGKP
jgi:fumarate hydratase class II